MLVRVVVIEVGFTQSVKLALVVACQGYRTACVLGILGQDPRFVA